MSLKDHPEAVRPVLPEIREFAKFCHHEILHEVLKLFALGLGLPEDELVNIHGFDAVGETYGPSKDSNLHLFELLISSGVTVRFMK